MFAQNRQTELLLERLGVARSRPVTKKRPQNTVLTEITLRYSVQNFWFVRTVG